ncbi:hypothetical protein OGY66_17785, partial [Citrobacter sp. CK205]|nr:hypothetical protein [Citrobacter sp. CK205]
AEVAAAQAKIYADKLESAPDYAARAEAAAEQASDSAQSALTAQNGANAAAGQANASANEAVQAAADAEDAAEAVFGSSLHAPTGEVLSTLPAAEERINTIPVFDDAGDATVKDISDFAILDSNGKIPVSMIPAVALSEVFVVNDQTEMLALDAQEGDVAKRTDLGYSFILASEPASTLSNWVQVSDDVLAQLGLSTGATEVGAIDDDGNPTTVQGALALKASKSYLSATTGATRVGALDSDGNQTTVQEAINSLNGDVSDLIGSVETITPAVRTVIFNHDDAEDDLTYGAFCDGVSLGRYEYLIHRESKTHFDDGGGVSILRVIKYDTQTKTHETFATFGPVSDYDYRDPSITWFPQIRRFVVTCALYNVPSAVHDKSVNYYLDAGGITTSTTYNTTPYYFQWGKALRTPQGQTMILAYTTSSGVSTVGVFVGNAAAGSETAFTKVSDVFTDDSTLLRNECSAIVWDGKLVVCARTQTNGSGNPLQNLSVIFTSDLSGTGGWSIVQRIPVDGVAPRMFIAPTGDLVITAGVTYQGSRGSVSAISTSNLQAWRTNNVVYSASGFGGYSSAYLRDDGLVGLYTFNEITAGTGVSGDPADTWLAYVPVTTFLYGYLSPKRQIHMYGNMPAYGMSPFYTEWTGNSENVYFFITNQIIINGFAFWCKDQTASSTTLYLENADGTTVSTIPGVPNTPTATLVNIVRSSGPLTLPSGLYRIRLDTGRIGYINNQHLYEINRNNLSHYTMGVGSLVSNIGKDCAIGLLL